MGHGIACCCLAFASVMIAPQLRSQEYQVATLDGGPRSHAQPGLSNGRFPVSLLAGGVLGTAGAAGGLLLGYVVFDCSDEGVRCERGPNDGELIGASIGLALGAATGAWFAGRRTDSQGRFLVDLLVASAGASLIMTAGGQYPDKTLGRITLVVTPVAVAFADHNIRRGRTRRVSLWPHASQAGMGVMATIPM